MSAEALYQAVKSGRVKLQDLNDSGKEALRSYMNEKAPAVMFQAHTGMAPNVNVSQSPVMQQAQQFKPPSFSPQTIAPVDVTKSPIMQQAQQYSATHPNPVVTQPAKQELPGRHIPVVGPILRTVDKLADNPFSNAVAEYAMPNAGFINQPDTNVRQQFLQDSGIKPATGVAKLAGQMVAPFAVPGAELGTANGLDAALSKAARKLPISNTARSLITGAGTFGATAAGAELAQGTGDMKQAAIQGLVGATLGGALGGLSPVIASKLAGTKLGESLSNLLSRSKSVTPEAEATAQRIFNTYKNPAGPQTLDEATNSIMQEVSNRITPPLENPKLLDKYLQLHLPEIPKSELDQLHYNDKAELATHIKDNLNIHDVASQVAKEKGLNWQDISSKARVADNGATHSPNVTESPMTRPVSESVRVSPQPLARTVEAPRASAITAKNPGELGFAQTVRDSTNTSPEIAQHLTDNPMLGNRTTNAADIQRAQAILTKKGVQGATQDLLAARKIGPVENHLAQELMHHYQKSGDIDSFLNVLNKTAQANRFMGQAIQALSRWNKLDADGAMLLANKIVNRGKSADEMIDLTSSQAKPVIAATEKIAATDKARSLADEVMQIVSSKKPGEQLNDAELATIRQFQSQVNDLNSKVKGFLPDKATQARKTVAEVSKIEPKERTRDQIVSYWEARERIAREKLAKQRNVGLISDTNNPVLLYAEIGVAKLMKGAVKTADFADEMVRDYGDRVKPIINQVYDKSVNLFRKSQGLPTTSELNQVVNKAVLERSLDKEEAARFKGWAQEIAFYTDDSIKKEAMNDLQLALKELNKPTLGQRVSTIQAVDQLLSIPTAVRNVIGNELFNVLQKTNKLAAVPIDWTLSKLTGERTIAFLPGNQESYWKNFVNGASSGWKGVSPNGQFEAMDIHPEAFKGAVNPFRYLQKATGAMLQSFDHAAYMRAYGETLGTYSKLTGAPIHQLDQTIHDIADEAGKYATFQDDTVLSKLATGTKRLLNKPTDMAAEYLSKKGVLPESASIKGFGMGDIILKYAKTPANIIMRGIDFSPIGLLRGVGELVPLLTKKEFDQRKAVLALSRGITGTLGLTILGYKLAEAGVLTGSQSNDKDIQQLDRMTGKGEYKVNWSALGRYIMSGFNKDEAQWKQGDRVFDWGWIQPMAISLAMGVNAQQAIEKQKEQGTNSWVATARDALMGSMNTILQQPLLQGVQNLVQGGTTLAKYGSWSGIANIFKGAPSSFVPAVVNQARNFSDNTTRNTYDPSQWKSAFNMVINKIPGLDRSLPVAYDTLGNTKEQIQGGKPLTLSQGLKTFVSPVKTTTYQVTPEAKMVVDLINSSGDDKVSPRTPNSYLMVNKQKVSLTPDQYSEIQQKTGEATRQALARMSGMLGNPNVPDEQKVSQVVAALTKVGQQVRKQLESEYPEFRSKKN